MTLRKDTDVWSLFLTLLPARGPGPLPAASDLVSELHPPWSQRAVPPLPTAGGSGPAAGSLHASCRRGGHRVSGQIGQDCPVQGREPGPEDGQRPVAGGTAEGAACSHRDMVTLATTCPPLCRAPRPRRLTAHTGLNGMQAPEEFRLLCPVGEAECGPWTGFSVTGRRVLRWREHANTAEH